MPESLEYSSELLLRLIQASIQNDNWSDITSEEVEEELLDVSVEFIIISTEAVIETRTGPVEGKAQVVAVNDHLAVPQLLPFKEIPAVCQEG